MPLTDDQKRERITRRTLVALISLWSLPTLVAGRPLNSPANTPEFDGARAYEHVRHLVEIGPRPPASDGIHRAQAYIIGQLKSYGCPVEEHDFHGSTPLGNLAMKNIVVKLPGAGSGIILYTTHYDTVRIPNFVGADDGGSDTDTLFLHDALPSGSSSTREPA